MLVAILGALAASAPSAQPQEADATKKVRLYLRPDATEILLREPLHATVALRNEAPEALDVNASYLPTIQFFRAYEGGPFARCGLGTYAGKSISGRRRLAPGKELTSAELLFLFRSEGRDALVFDRPGEYQVKVRMEVKGRAMESEAVSIFVKPLPPDHVAAAKLVVDRDSARMLQGWGFEAQGAKALDRLLADFPHSLYADHANHVLGQYYRWQPPSGPGKDMAKSLQLHSAVSARIAAMRTRALLAMADLATSAPELRAHAKVTDLARELDGYRSVAALIGLEETFADLRKKLEALAKPTRSEEPASQ